MEKQAYCIVDLGFGDAGKGRTVAYLASEHKHPLVVRYNGGPQAGHNVVLQDGTHHTFAQFGSATFQPGAGTYLSQYMLIDPYAMLNEEAHLRQLGVTDVFDRLWVSGAAKIITPYHQVLNRMRELARGDGRHGSCGMGVGEAVSTSLSHPALTITLRDCLHPRELTERLVNLRVLKAHEAGILAPQCASGDKKEQFSSMLDVLLDDDMLRRLAEFYSDFVKDVRMVDDAKDIVAAHDALVFEGAQGVLLDEVYGFYPHTTWSNTTLFNAHAILRRLHWAGDVTSIGLTRTYMTRHGTGPFPTESVRLPIDVIRHEHNAENDWQGRFRVGCLDFVLLEYALRVVGRQNIDCLAVTHMDKLPDGYDWPVTDRYRIRSQDVRPAFISAIHPTRPTTTEHQAEIGKKLACCTPVVRYLHRTSVSAYIHAALGIPVGLLGYGADASLTDDHMAKVMT